jgi:hypothetical protein
MNYRWKWDAENNIITKFGHRKGSVCVCCIEWQKAPDHVNWDKIYVGSQGNWDLGGRKKLIRNLYMDQGFKLRLDQGREKKCEDWKRSWKWMPFFFHSIQILKPTTYQGNSWRIWRIENWRLNNSYSKICKVPCARGCATKDVTRRVWQNK